MTLLWVALGLSTFANLACSVMLMAQRRLLSEQNRVVELQRLGVREAGSALVATLAAQRHAERNLLRAKAELARAGVEFVEETEEEQSERLSS